MNEFLIKNYIWFLVIAVILAFGLIGFLIESKGKKVAVKSDEDKERENLETIQNSNMTLGDALKKDEILKKPEEEKQEVVKEKSSDSDIEEDPGFNMMVDEPDK